MEERGSRRTAWFLSYVALRVVSGGKSRCRPIQQLVLEGELRAGEGWGGAQTSFWAQWFQQLPDPLGLGH